MPGAAPPRTRCAECRRRPRGPRDAWAQEPAQACVLSGRGMLVCCLHAPSDAESGHIASWSGGAARALVAQFSAAVRRRLPAFQALATFAASSPHHGVVACSALLSAAPFTAPASCTAHWKKTCVPDGTPGGNDGTLSCSVPPGLVTSTSVSATGTVTRVPPLKGVGVLASETNRSATAKGLALPSFRATAAVATSVPSPSRTGTPLLPGSPKPR